MICQVSLYVIYFTAEGIDSLDVCFYSSIDQLNLLMQVVECSFGALLKLELVRLDPFHNRGVLEVIQDRTQQTYLF